MELTRRHFLSTGAAIIAGISTLPIMSVAQDANIPNEETDVVVIGAGGAGMTAAIKSAEAGLRVIVLEKEKIVGGNTKLASSNFTAAGAQVQKDAGIEGATPDALYDKLLSDDTDPEAIRILADKSGAAADFLTSIGMDLSRCWATFNCSTADGSAPGIPEVEALENRMLELGVTCRCGALATGIIRNASGAVEGVEVQDADVTYSISSPVVIVASGGFAANAQMVSEYDPRWNGLTYSCGPQATGEGTQIAIDAGASVSNMDNVKVNPTAYYLDDVTAISLAPIRINGGIMVATNLSAENSGKRILNEEGAYTPNSEIIVNNGGMTYMIFDQTLVDDVDAIKSFHEAGYLIEAASLEDLAELIDVDKATFLETCSSWTKCVASGEDPDFGKTNFTTDLTIAPFYAVPAKPAIQGTFGGLTTQVATTAVLDTDGQIIPGLFACGECADDGTYGNAPTTVNVVFGTIAAASAEDYID